MQTSLRRRHRDRVVRRGLGLVIESDFYATDAGRAHFANQLTSIRYCVQETCNFDVLYACAAARPDAHLHRHHKRDRHSPRVAARPRRYLTCGNCTPALGPFY